jgi:hypothetical protein
MQRREHALIDSQNALPERAVMTQLRSHNLSSAVRQASMFAGVAVIVVAILSLADLLSTLGQRDAEQAAETAAGSAKTNHAARPDTDAAIARRKEMREEPPPMF